MGIIIYKLSKKSTQKDLEKVSDRFENLEKIINPSDILTSPQEKESKKEILLELFNSSNKEKQQASKLLKAGKVEQAIKILEKLNTVQSDITVDTKLELATLHSYTDVDRALVLLQEAVALAPDNIVANNAYALLLMRIGQVEKAKDIFWGMLKNNQINKKHRGAVLGNLGNVYKMLGDYDQAEKYWQKSIAILDAIHSPNAEVSRKNLKILLESKK